MKIFLLRHAESESNALRRPVSLAEEGLSDRGRHQAEQIVSVLQGLSFTEVLCSTHTRARQTIEPFLKQSDSRIEYSDLLVEGHLVINGQSRTVKETEKSNQESAKEFLHRVELAWQLILRCQSNVLIVTHGHMIRALLNLILDITATVRFPHDNCGLTCVELGDEIRVEYLNRVLCT